MLRFLAIIALIIMPTAAISVQVSMSGGTSTGILLDGIENANIKMELSPIEQSMIETGSCSGGKCTSWISHSMYYLNAATWFWQSFQTEGHNDNWWYGVGNGMIGTSVAIK